MVCAGQSVVESCKKMLHLMERTVLHNVQDHHYWSSRNLLSNQHVASLWHSFKCAKLLLQQAYPNNFMESTAKRGGMIRPLQMLLVVDYFSVIPAHEGEVSTTMKPARYHSGNTVLKIFTHIDCCINAPTHSN